MTAELAIARADALMPNQFSQEEKLRWIETLELLLQEETGLEGGEALLASGAHEEIYIHWIHAKALYFLGEFVRYQNAMAQFNNTLLAFTAAQTRSARKASAQMRF